MKIKALPLLLGLAQTLSILRVVQRLLATAWGERLTPTVMLDGRQAGHLSVIVPVLNEYHRLALCLDGLLDQGPEVAEILVVDGGSCDGTQALVETYMHRDTRVRLVDASPIPAGWNGKTWGLHCGFQQAASASEWILTMDADVRPGAMLVATLLTQADKTGLRALSVATLQEIEGLGLGLLHPSLLTTLVYRFGSPGRPISKVSEVQANGQCFLCQRTLLESCGGFAMARTSLCEDVTIARTIVAAGHPVGFYEAGELVSVRMYQDWRETWQNWPRSLTMQDRFAGKQTLLSWLEIALVQALPLPLFCALVPAWRSQRGLCAVNGVGLLLRLGILFGTTRAYRSRPWSYWLSPLCDVPVVLKLGLSALQRKHTWRGRTIIRGGQE